MKQQPAFLADRHGSNARPGDHAAKESPILLDLDGKDCVIGGGRGRQFKTSLLLDGSAVMAVVSRLRRVVFLPEGSGC
jgi:hypothetical protein